MQVLEYSFLFVFFASIHFFKANCKFNIANDVEEITNYA